MSIEKIHKNNNGEIKVERFYNNTVNHRVNRNNFFIASYGRFEKITTGLSITKSEPDFISYNEDGEISSKYWYTDKYLFRQSDHWNKVRQCYWELDSDDYWVDIPVIGRIKWESLYPIIEVSPSFLPNGVSRIIFQEWIYTIVKSEAKIHCVERDGLEGLEWYRTIDFIGVAASNKIKLENEKILSNG